jgi:hypothetical protein
MFTMYDKSQGRTCRPVLVMIDEAGKQHLQSTRRNPLPVKRIDGSLLMCHKHLACALVEQMESGKTSSGPDRVLHHAPEAFDRIEVMATMGR